MSALRLINYISTDLHTPTCTPAPTTTNTYTLHPCASYRLQLARDLVEDANWVCVVVWARRAEVPVGAVVVIACWCWCTCALLFLLYIQAYVGFVVVLLSCFSCIARRKYCMLLLAVVIVFQIGLFGGVSCVGWVGSHHTYGCLAMALSTGAGSIWASGHPGTAM